MNTSPSSTKSNELTDLLGRLSLSSEVLNKTLDNVGVTVSSINQSLQRMNIGVSACAETGFSWERSDGDFENHLLTYSKVDGAWGLQIVVISGNVYDQESVTCDTFRFNHAPREARAAAIMALPALLRSLTHRTEEMTKQIVNDSSGAIALASALEDWQVT